MNDCVEQATLTKNEVTRLSVDLDPFITSIGQPLETSLLEQVHLVCPSEFTMFVSEDIVVLLTDLVTSLQDQEATIFRAVGQEVDETLYAAQTTTFRVLILVRPGSIGGKILTVGERHIDGIE
jgi:hypothetical protein